MTMKNKISLLFVFILLPNAAVHAQADTKKSSIANVVRTLGYGGAIHNFKNFVLRGDSKYGDVSEQMFKDGSQQLVALANEQGLTASEKEAVSTIQAAVKAYQQHLPKVKKLHQQGMTVEQIDESVLVNDAPAIKALASLREGHEWRDIDDLDFYLGYGSGIHNFKNFVLRADEKYRAKASLGLSETLLVVSRFGGGDKLSADHRKALDDIEAVVRSYEDTLVQIQKLIGEGKTAIEIDDAVKIDDGPAFRGLMVLRKR